MQSDRIIQRQPGKDEGSSKPTTIKPAVVQVESHPYLPEWELLDYCRKNGIVLQAFTAPGHSSEPNLLSDPVITNIANRVGKTPPQVLLAWAIQRGTALLTTTKTPRRLEETTTSPPFPKTPCGRLAKESSRGSGLMPLWRRAFPGSSREVERQSLPRDFLYHLALLPIRHPAG